MCIQDFAKCGRIDKCTCTTWFHVLHVEPSGEHQKNTAWFNEIGSLTSLMHVTHVHPVTTENQFHCTKLYAVWQRILAYYIALNGLYTLSGDIFLSGGMLIQRISRRVIMIECEKPQITFCLTHYVPMLSTTQQPLVSLRPHFFSFFFFKLPDARKKAFN